jgi:hypothetical protein
MVFVARVMVAHAGAVGAQVRGSRPRPNGQAPRRRAPATCRSMTARAWGQLARSAEHDRPAGAGTVRAIEKRGNREDGCHWRGPRGPGDRGVPGALGPRRGGHGRRCTPRSRACSRDGCPSTSRTCPNWWPKAPLPAAFASPPTFAKHWMAPRSCSSASAPRPCPVVAPTCPIVEAVGRNVAAFAQQDLVLVGKSTVPANTGARLQQVDRRGSRRSTASGSGSTSPPTPSSCGKGPRCRTRSTPTGSSMARRPTSRVTDSARCTPRSWRRTAARSWRPTSPPQS